MEICSGIIDHIGAQTMPHLTCTMISSVDLAHYGVSHAKDRISVDCGTRQDNCEEIWKFAWGLSIIQSHKPCSISFVP